MGLIRVSDQTEIKTTIKISMNICYCHLSKHSVVTQDIASIPNRRAISSKILKDSSVKVHSLSSGKNLKIRPFAIFSFYSLNYSLAARLQDNSLQRSPTKVETKRKLQQLSLDG